MKAKESNDKILTLDTCSEMLGRHLYSIVKEDGAYRVSNQRLTIGQCGPDSPCDNAIRIMCHETGIGSGAVYNTQDYWLSKDDAQAECDRRNAIVGNGEAKPKIYCFNNGGSAGWYSAVGLSQDGDCLAQHICSHEGFMAHDLGITSDWKHEQYWNAYPNGWELEWVSDPKAHEGLAAAIAIAEGKAVQS